jgi:hypothetical protein
MHYGRFTLLNQKKTNGFLIPPNPTKVGVLKFKNFFKLNSKPSLSYLNFKTKLLDNDNTQSNRTLSQRLKFFDKKSALIRHGCFFNIVFYLLIVKYPRL